MVDGFRRFSTSGVSEPERIERWEQHNAEALVPLAARSIDGAPLEATEINLQLPNLQFAHVSANPHVVERTPGHIAASGTDGVALYFKDEAKRESEATKLAALLERHQDTLAMLRVGFLR